MEVKEKLGAVELVGSFGCALIVVFGAVSSYVTEYELGASTFVAVSAARARTT